MKPKLVEKPNSYELQKLLVNFAGGVPLSADQLNFLSRHEKALSAHGLDHVLKYYLKPLHKKSMEHHSFLMHRENMNAESAKELKRRLQLMLTDKGQRVKFPMTSKQFIEFKNSAYPSLILYHGNQFLTGAPFYLGGIPHVVFFQWGNLFGVAKYVVLAEEKALASNVLIYFEEMHERNLEQCVLDFTKDMRHELKPTHQVAQTHHLEKTAPHENYTPASPFQTPKLSLSIGTLNKEQK